MIFKKKSIIIIDVRIAHWIVCYIRMLTREGARCVKRHPKLFNVRNGYLLVM